MFKLSSKFKPTGDQPEAIGKLSRGLDRGNKHQTLVGVTGSGKTFTMANVIAHRKKPTLVISHNKTLAAQLYQEFREFFPENSVNYFVSYYDYYQPEAYIPHTNTYIEKDAKINEEIDRLRHTATENLISRSDVIIVASVSCIYNLGSPEDYKRMSLDIAEGRHITLENLYRNVLRLQYEPEIELARGSVRKTRTELEIVSSSGERITKITMKGEGNRQRIAKIWIADSVNLESLSYNLPKYEHVVETTIFPAKYWVTSDANIALAIQNIRAELQKHVKKLERDGKSLEADRLARRTEQDIYMIRQVGYCHGIENYSRHFEFRKQGDPPYTLIDYFRTKGDFLTIVDESHLTIPQIRGMHRGDLSRKATLVEHGFRLPSALDNRPLRFEEFEKRVGQTIYASATPAMYELKKSKKNGITEQLVRPTGLLDPVIYIEPTKNQIKRLIAEIKKCAKRKQRVLVTTFTKRMAEDLTDFLTDEGIRANYIHSDVKTLDRLEILHDLRLGNYDVLVGVNLLREGLDLPEVSLVAILDADKEGFLRNATTLIQTMGRAARHIDGRVVMYADTITGSMQKAIDETNRRRAAQIAYNAKHGITPASIIKAIKRSDLSSSHSGSSRTKISNMEHLQKDIEKAVKNLEFDHALALRERLLALRKKI